jgi:RHS repeat-associated protein
MSRTWETDQTGVYEQVNTLLDWKGTTAWDKKYLDGFSRVYRTSSLGPDGVRAVLIDQSYNSSNQVVQRSLPYYEGSTPSYTQIYFDEYKRTIRLQEPSPVDDGTTVITTIDYQTTNHVVVTQASGTQQALKTTYDYAYCNGKQLVTKRTDAMQAYTTYAYDGLGRMTSVVDPGGVTSTTGYDTVGRPVSFASRTDSAVLWKKTYSYDDISGKETHQDAKGNQIVIQKDALGRPLSKTATAVDVPGTETTNFIFDSAQSSYSQGRISSVTMPDGSTYTYQYDAYGNQTSISLSVDGHNWTVQHSYGPTRKLQTRTHADGGVETHVYTTGGDLSEIDLAENAQAPASRLISYADVTSMGKPQAITYSNGVSESLNYGTLGQLKSQTVTGPGTTAIYSGSFEKNVLGLLSSATDPLSQSQQVFGYDGVGRLSGVSGGTTSRSYQYDSAGNISLKDGIQYVSAGNEVGTGTQNGSTVFQGTFDPNGNIAQATRNGATTKYLYDAENRLASAGTTTFSYDYSGRRLKKQVSGGPTVYSVAPYYQVAVFPDNSQQHTKLVYGDGGALVSVTSVDAGSPPAYKGIAAPGVFYNHPDRLGSVVRQTDGQGKLVNSIDYDPFGAVSSSSQVATVPAMFTGKEWDDSTGLYYFGARYYDPVLGRFLTPDDRTGGPMGSRDVLHPYAYCTNDPVNYVDPFGHSIGGFFESAYSDVASFASTQGGHFLHDLDQLRYNRTFELVTSFVVDGALIIGGGVALFFGFGTLGSALMGAGITGLVYDIKVAATGQSFSWKDWGEQLAIGGLTGLVAGGIAAGAALAADSIAEAGTSAANAAFEIGAAGRMTLNVVAGAIGGGAGNVAGQVLANEFSDNFTGQDVTAGLGYAALSGVVLGGVGTAIGEGTTRALSYEPNWGSATVEQEDKYTDRLWTRTDDFKVTGRDLPFQRVLDDTPKNKVLVFLPGYVANWAAFGVSVTQTFRPSWFPTW